MRIWKLALWALLFPLGLGAQVEDPKDVTTTRLLFILDASNSMYGRWDGETKMEIAQRLMIQTLDSLAKLPNPNFQLALRVYGHQHPVPPQKCDDSKLEVPFSYSNFEDISQVLQKLRPLGTTPIAYSLRQAGANDFSKVKYPCPTGHCRDLILLITDGIDACGDNICEASANLQRKGITLKPFVIGVGLDTTVRKNLECVGTYFDAGDPTTFKKALNVIVEQALDPTTGQINLGNPQGEEAVTNLPILLRNTASHMVDRSIIHTMNFKKNPDTLSFDPNTEYQGTVYSIPPQNIHVTTIQPSVHNFLESQFELGSFQLIIPGYQGADYGPVAIVREKGKAEILHVQKPNTVTKYVAGDYEIDVLTLPRKHFDIHIPANEPITRTVEAPGSVTVQLRTACYGAIFYIQGQEQSENWTWVTNLDETQTRQQFSLQPGTYKVVFRAQGAQQTSYSKTTTFNVAGGSTTLVRIP